MTLPPSSGNASSKSDTDKSSINIVYDENTTKGMSLKDLDNGLSQYFQQLSLWGKLQLHYEVFSVLCQVVAL